jgi:serine protease Do
MFNLKQLLPLIIAGMAGGALTLALTGRTPSSTDSPPLQAQQVSYVNARPGTVEELPDFVGAAAKSMPAVVHIKAAESEQQARMRIQRERQRNPWSYMEEDLLYGFFNQRPNNRRLEGYGSGVIYREDGIIVTNNHVIEFAEEIEVTLSDNRRYRASIIGTDPKTDMAVLKIEATGLPTLEMGDSDKANVGEWVLAVGNPFDLNSTVTAGIISAKGRNIEIIKSTDAIEAFIQTDAAVNPGNSGGALVNSRGQLLGINTAIATQTGYYSGYSFAIPVNMVRRIVDAIVETGYFQRAKMGLSVVELDGELARELELTITQGLVVEYVEEGGPAQKAGLKPFDVIVDANGNPVRSFPELQEQTSQIRPGDMITLKVIRDGKPIQIKIRMQ